MAHPTLGPVRRTGSNNSQHTVYCTHRPNKIVVPSIKRPHIQLECIFNAPPGTRAVLYEDPDSRISWGARGTDAWYCDPSLDHCPCCIFYLHKTRSYHISGSFDLFPQHCLLPKFSPEQHANEVHDELYESIHSLSRPAKSNILKKISKYLCTLATIKLDPPLQRVDISPTSEGEQSILRVGATPPVTTSTNPTALRILREKPRTHQQQPRNNTPGATPPSKY